MDFKWPGEKLAEKMWESLAEKGVGALLTPWQSRRAGKAQAEVRSHEILALAQAEADAADIKAGKKRFQKDGTLLTIPQNDCTNILLLPSTVDGRVEPTFNIEQLVLNSTAMNAADYLRAEVNVARAVIMAEEILNQTDQELPEATIADDWLHDWNEYAGKVSSEELQRIWANVLAGEVKAPGTYSVRTLEFLRTLSKPEAEKIAELARYVIMNVFIPRDLSDFLRTKGIEFSTLLEMQELGILTGVDAMGLNWSLSAGTEQNIQKILPCNDKMLIVRGAKWQELKLGIYALTNLGKQVMRLGSFSADPEYINAFGKKIASQGFEVEMADIVSANNGTYHFVNSTTIVP